jgi:hypothetical protein
MVKVIIVREEPALTRKPVPQLPQDKPQTAAVNGGEHLSQLEYADAGRTASIISAKEERKCATQDQLETMQGQLSFYTLWCASCKHYDHQSTSRELRASQERIFKPSGSSRVRERLPLTHDPGRSGVNEREITRIQLSEEGGEDWMTGDFDEVPNYRARK